MMKKIFIALLLSLTIVPVGHSMVLQQLQEQNPLLLMEVLPTAEQLQVGAELDVSLMLADPQASIEVQHAQERAAASKVSVMDTDACAEEVYRCIEQCDHRGLLCVLDGHHSCRFHGRFDVDSVVVNAAVRARNICALVMLLRYAHHKCGDHTQGCVTIENLLTPVRFHSRMRNIPANWVPCAVLDDDDDPNLTPQALREAIAADIVNNPKQAYAYVAYFEQGAHCDDAMPEHVRLDRRDSLRVDDVAEYDRWRLEQLGCVTPPPQPAGRLALPPQTATPTQRRRLQVLKERKAAEHEKHAAALSRSTTPQALPVLYTSRLKDNSYRYKVQQFLSERRFFETLGCDAFKTEVFAEAAAETFVKEPDVAASLNKFIGDGAEQFVYMLLWIARESKKAVTISPAMLAAVVEKQNVFVVATLLQHVVRQSANADVALHQLLQMQRRKPVDRTVVMPCGNDDDEFTLDDEVSVEEVLHDMLLSFKHVHEYLALFQEGVKDSVHAPAFAATMRTACAQYEIKLSTPQRSPQARSLSPSMARFDQTITSVGGQSRRHRHQSPGATSLSSGRSTQSGSPNGSSLTPRAGACSLSGSTAAAEALLSILEGDRRAKNAQDDQRAARERECARKRELDRFGKMMSESEQQARLRVSRAEMQGRSAIHQQAQTPEALLVKRIEQLAQDRRPQSQQEIVAAQAALRRLVEDRKANVAAQSQAAQMQRQPAPPTSRGPISTGRSAAVVRDARSMAGQGSNDHQHRHLSLSASVRAEGRDALPPLAGRRGQQPQEGSDDDNL